MRNAGWIAVLILIASGCRSTVMPRSNVDHIMLGVSNLEEGMAAFEAATGVKPVIGGTHPGRGTQNALVSLGNGTYLEIIAPQTQPDASDAMVRGLQALTAPRLMGWAEHVADTATARAALERAGFTLTPAQPGSRVTPAGARLEWTTFGIVKPEIATAPFFIEWGKTTTHPSKTSPAGCSVASFQVDDLNAAALNRLFQATEMSMHSNERGQPRITLTVKCGERSARFTSD